MTAPDICGEEFETIDAGYSQLEMHSPPSQRYTESELRPNSPTIVADSTTSSISSNKHELTLPALPTVEPEETQQPLIAVDSFLPMIQLLPNTVINGVHHVHGAVSTDTIHKLKAYNIGIGELTLKDNAQNINPGAFLRLVQLHNREAPGPLLPSLHRLRIESPGSSIDLINLCLSPSLETLEVISVEQSTSLSVFVDTLGEEMPNLTSLVIASVPNTISTAYSKFQRLLRLELLDGSHNMDQNVLQDIGSIPALEIFVLKAKSLQSPSSDHNDWGTPGLLERSETLGAHHPTRYFSRLRKLHVAGDSALLVYLLASVKSDAIEDLALTLLWSSSTTSKNKKFKAKRETDDYLNQVRLACSRWTRTLRVLHIGRIKEYNVAEAITGAVKAPTVTTNTLNTIFQLESVEQLSMTGWSVLPTDFSLVKHWTARQPRIQVLRLPLHDISCGLSLTAIREIVRAQPQLSELRCRIEDPVGIPMHPESDGISVSKDVLSHGLRVLSVGNLDLYQPDQLFLITRYLASMFPSIESIETHVGYNEKQWEDIGKLFKLCRNVIMDNAQRT